MPELVGGLHFPTSVAVGNGGELFVAESGLPFGGAPPGGRVWRLNGGGGRHLVVEGLSPPVNGLTWFDGSLLVSEGGAGRILRLELDGSTSTVVEGLPGPGDYQVNMAVGGPDGMVYFSQGSMTNTSVVGLDSLQLGWLARIPDAHDIPGFDVVLAGFEATTDDPREGRHGPVHTGAFCPFGVGGPRGRELTGEVPCTAAVMRCQPDGTGLELVAWGLRNAFGLAFLPDGRLLAIDQGADDRGSRPLGGVPDLLFAVEPAAWYGWPDFVGGVPVTDPRFRPSRGPEPTFVLANHAQLPAPGTPLAAFQPHAAATKLCVLPDGSPWPGQLVVTLFGDEAPMTAPSGPRVGRSVVRVDPADWSIHPLALPGPRLHRPIDVAWDPVGRGLLVLDFGRFEMKPAAGVVAEAASGALWRIPMDERGDC